MIDMGHNERSYRLDAIAERARAGLAAAERGEQDAIAGWIAYGAALNEGRALFPSDLEFGRWVEAASLRQLGGEEVHDHMRAAAMWAAANAEQFAEARAAGDARTVRGIHAVWKRLEKERAEEAARAARTERLAASGEEAPAGLDVGRRGLSERPGRGADDDTDEALIEEAPAPRRTGLSHLTREALEDDLIATREALALEKEKSRALADEVASLKERLSEALKGDLGRSLGNALRRIDEVNGRAKEHMASAARLQRQCNAQEAEIKRLRAEIAAQVIPL